jgi:hypothetical protein
MNLGIVLIANITGFGKEFVDVSDISAPEKTVQKEPLPTVFRALCWGLRSREKQYLPTPLHHYILLTYTLSYF